MSSLRHQVCQNHPAREAIARCPSCRFYFCRECITEHDDRILCATCLKRQSARVERPRRNFAPLARGLAACGGLMLAWLYFYLIGRVLLATPTKFHEGTLWKNTVESAIDQEEAP